MRSIASRPSGTMRAAPADMLLRDLLKSGASQHSTAAAPSSANKHHKNHSGPHGQKGSAVQCAQKADKLGSAAVKR